MAKLYNWKLVSGGRTGNSLLLEGDIEGYDGAKVGESGRHEIESSKVEDGTFIVTAPVQRIVRYYWGRDDGIVFIADFYSSEKGHQFSHLRLKNPDEEWLNEMGKTMVHFCKNLKKLLESRRIEYRDEVDGGGKVNYEEDYLSDVWEDKDEDFWNHGSPISKRLKVYREHKRPSRHHD
jgi:hypothetical protein